MGTACYFSITTISNITSSVPRYGSLGLSIAGSVIVGVHDTAVHPNLEL